MMNKAIELNINSGIYCSYYQWEDLFGLDYVYSRAKSFPMWYAHYDNAQTYGDFKPFGGWTEPYMKQYKGDTTLCGQGVDLNFKQ